MGKKKLLFVDDEPVVARLMKTRLESRGLEVDTAGNGYEALQKAKEGRPDVILLDVIMPGMDGFETCRQLKAMQETLHIPVILFTASQETHLDETARKAGADRVVQKPFVDQAYQAIVEILGPL